LEDLSDSKQQEKQASKIRFWIGRDIVVLGEWDTTRSKAFHLHDPIPYRPCFVFSTSFSSSSPHRRSTSLPHLRPLIPLLVYTFGQQLGIIVGGVFLSLHSSPLESDAVALVLQSLGSNETLNLRGFGVGFFAFALGLDFSSNHKFSGERRKVS
jgi:hypothetical protein